MLWSHYGDGQYVDDTGPSVQTDTFGSSTTAVTNGTTQVIVATNAYEPRGQSFGAIMLASFVLLCIVLTLWRFIVQKVQTMVVIVLDLTTSKLLIYQITILL